MADDKNIPDTNTHEGLGALSDEQIKEMEHVVDSTDHPYRDPVTGKMNEDIAENEVGVSQASQAAKKHHAEAMQMAVDKPEEDENANQWEDPYLEDR